MSLALLIKIIKFTVRVMLTLAVMSAGAYLLYRYEYIVAFNEVDNVIGALPVVFVVISVLGLIVLVWMKHGKRLAPLAVVLAMIVALSSALFPNALLGNWRLISSSSDMNEIQPDISVYEPFKQDSLTAKLDGSPTLTFTENLPVLDGALALYPVYAAFAEAVYDKGAYEASQSMLFTNTVEAFNAIIAGERDVVFIAAASQKQLQSAKDVGVELHFTPIGKEAFVFLVGAENPISDISCQQIRNIYSGKTAKWRTLGWEKGGDIIAFQRPEGSGSQTGLQNIMGDLPIQSPQPLPDASLIGSNSLMQQISVEWKGVQPAIGYSYRFFATTMFPNRNAKLLKVNGVEPSTENIRSGRYPFVMDFYAVTNGVPEGNARLLIDWILSPQGQGLIEKSGYTPVNG